MKWLSKIPEDNLFSKVNFTVAEKSRNLKIFCKIAEAIIAPVFIGILAGWGSWITGIFAIFWWGVGIYGLFTNWEDFIIMIILRFFGIVE